MLQRDDWPTGLTTEFAVTDQPDAVKQRHLLVVDDNLELAETYRELFQSHGYLISLAANGVQGLKFILNHPVDAVLCDLSMPQLEGDMFHLTVQRVRPQLSRRFVFITGNAGDPRYDDFLKNAGCPVLYKPVSVVRLLEVLSGLFGPA
jgi:CheY-like chemotaxis protein